MSRRTADSTPARRQQAPCRKDHGGEPPRRWIVSGEQHGRGDLQHGVGGSAGHQIEQLVPPIQEEHNRHNRLHQETEEDADSQRDQHVLDQDSDAHPDQGP